MAKVLVDGGSGLNIIFSSTLENMVYDMTTLVPSDQAFYGIIPGAGSTPVGRVTLLVTFGTRDNYETESINFEVASFDSDPPTTPYLGGRRSPSSWLSPTTHIFS